MATSVVQIYNMALGHVGVAQEVSAADESSTEASICSRFYEQARDEVLEAFDWPFARKYRALALVEEGPNDDWLYSYRYPTDCLTARRIVTGKRIDPNPVAYELGHDEQGLVLYTDQEDAVLRYTARFEDPAFYSPKFAMALSWRLAALIARPLTQNDSERKNAEAMYEIALSEAETKAANEGQLDAAPESEFITARG